MNHIIINVHISCKCFEHVHNKTRFENVTLSKLSTVVSSKYAPSFCNLSTIKNRRGAYTRDATFSLAITPSPGARPQLRVEDNAFAVAIWKNIIYTCGSPV